MNMPAFWISFAFGLALFAILRRMERTNEKKQDSFDSLLLLTTPFGFSTALYLGLSALIPTAH